MGERGRKEGGKEPEEEPETTGWGRRKVERRQCRSEAEDNTYRGIPKCYHEEDVITREARKYHNMAECIKE